MKYFSIGLIFILFCCKNPNNRRINVHLRCQLLSNQKDSIDLHIAIDSIKFIDCTIGKLDLDYPYIEESIMLSVGVHNVSVIVNDSLMQSRVVRVEKDKVYDLNVFFREYVIEYQILEMSIVDTTGFYGIGIGFREFYPKMNYN